MFCRKLPPNRHWVAFKRNAFKGHLSLEFDHYLPLELQFLVQSTWMSQEASKWSGSVDYDPSISHLYVGYNPFTNHLLTSWHIQVGAYVSPIGSQKRPQIPTLVLVGEEEIPMTRDVMGKQ